jgi:drug/metabolite transporter (DMT)-like permease
LRNPDKNTTLRAMLAAFLTAILYSASAITGRRASHFLTATHANLSRLLFGACLLGLWSHLFGFGLSGKAFPWLFLSGCIGFGIGDLSMFQAYPRIGARRTIVIIQCLAAPFAAVMEWAWLNNKPTIAQALYGALILAGVGIALMPSKDDAQPTHELGIGIAFGILSALCQGGGAVLSRVAYAVADRDGHPFTHGPAAGLNVAYQRMVGGIAVTLLFVAWQTLRNRSATRRKSDWKHGWIWLIGNALAGPVLGVTCYQWALMSYQTNIVLPIVAITPLLVIPLAHFFEGDRITRRAVIGGIIAVAGVVGLARVR